MKRIAPKASAKMSDAFHAALWAALEARNFSTEHWEKAPLLLSGTQAMEGLMATILSAQDLPALSERLSRFEEPPQQVMRDGERRDPRELCLDFLNGGSAIINRIDTLWAPVGRLCQALRANFLHVFAVFYLTPRASRAVPAHSDDQDVFIVQVAGRKSWTVYGAPIELPHTHEQLGKHEPIDYKSLGPPLLTAELSPGSVLYLPRGFVHEARATEEGGSSLHITLTVQTSDLNWSTFLRDGIAELHRHSAAARLPLPLDIGFGGFAGCGAGYGLQDLGNAKNRVQSFSVTGNSVDTSSRGRSGDAIMAVESQRGGSGIGEICEGEYRGRSSEDYETAAVGIEAAAADAESFGASGAAALAAEAAERVRMVDALMGDTSIAADAGFDAAMSRLEAKLDALNGSQDAAIRRCATDGVEVNGRLPRLLRIIPGIDMTVRDSPAGDGMIQLVCRRQDGTLTATFAPRLVDALLYMASTVNSPGQGEGMHASAFRASDLPCCDDLEQQALCYRLLNVKVLCDASATIPGIAPDDDGSGYMKGGFGKGGGGFGKGGGAGHGGGKRGGRGR